MEQAKMKEAVIAKLDVKDGMRILDIGCGNGGDLIALGGKHPRAAYYGIDKSESGIRQAKERTQGDERFYFDAQDLAGGLPFADGFFDAAFSVNLLECIVEKDALLREISRVLKPGGQILMAHYDFDTQLFDGSDKNLVRHIVQAYSDWQQAWMDDCDAWMGRRLWKYMNGSGLFSGDIDVLVLTNTTFAPGQYGYERAMDFKALAQRGLIQEADYEQFLRDLHDLSEKDQYFYSISMFVYKGCKCAAV